MLSYWYKRRVGLPLHHLPTHRGDGEVDIWRIPHYYLYSDRYNNVWIISCMTMAVKLTSKQYLIIQATGIVAIYSNMNT